MLYLPNAPLPPKKSKTGIARGRSASGFWLRGRASVINAQTPSMTRWRQVFGQAKRNWLAIGPGGANNAPTNDITPQNAWAIQAASYKGIIGGTYTVDGIAGMPLFTGCATEEAFQVMVQTTLAQLGQPSADAPVITNATVDLVDAGGTVTIGVYTVSLYGLIGTGGPFPSLVMNMKTDPTGSVPTDYSFSFTGLPANVTAENTTPDAYPDAQITFTTSYGAATGNSDVAVLITGPGGSGTITVTIRVISGDQIPVLPPPIYILPDSASSKTTYDLSYNVTAFTLTYQVLPSDGALLTRFGIPVQQQWMLTASPCYASSYAKPATTAYLQLTANAYVLLGGAGVNLGNPSDAVDPLTAWVAVFGDLPDTGKIAFLIAPVDPITGCPGPSLEAIAEWEVGTLLGADLSVWEGPMFSIGGGYGTEPLTVGVPRTFDIFLYPTNGTVYPVIPQPPNYSGTIALSIVKDAVIPAGNNTTTKSFPPNVTATLSTTTITITGGYPAPATASFTLEQTAANRYVFSGALNPSTPGFSGPIKIEATDGIQTVSTNLSLQMGGDLPPLPSDFVYMGPTPIYAVDLPPGSYTIPYTVYNEGPDEQYVVMVEESPNTGISMSFSPISLNVPAVAATVQGTSPITTIGQGPGSNGGFAQISLPDVGSALDGAVCPYLTGSFVGWHVQYTDSGDPTYNVANSLITANDVLNVQTATPYTLGNSPWGGTITLTNPDSVVNTPAPNLTTRVAGAASTVGTMVIAPGTLTPGTIVNVEASCGVYSNYVYVVFQGPNVSESEMSPSPITIDGPGVGTFTQVLDYYGDSENPAVMLLTVSCVIPGSTVSISPETLTIPPRTGDVPSHVTATVTYTFVAGTVTLNQAIQITGQHQSSIVPGGPLLDDGLFLYAIGFVS